eukprot:CAMPEP_0115863448 /NCGR_PEP_ID=MMETSP0287-20121206/18694_1 /TAXON_ID=412157 /ORGANISM="Chrysochromulina rotalis, Strain UIO044" /LENGTH=34 /DNA_ID= /DNA_START= /DNA_END= /DNA_ORIENTATION=
MAFESERGAPFMYAIALARRRDGTRRTSDRITDL